MGSLWVDSFYPGTYSMAVVASPEVPGDLCSNLVTTPLDAGTPLRLTGELGNAFSDVSLACGPGGRDVGYRFEAPAGAYFEATLASLDGGAATLELRGPGASCPGPTLGATCRTGTTSTRVSGNPLAAGTWHLWVKGAGAYALDLNLASALPGDRCTNPLPLTFTNGAAVVTGSTADALNDIPPSFGCGLSGPDLVYSFTLATAQTFSATITTGGLRPSLFLRSTCTDGLDVCSTAPAGQGSTAIGPRMLMPGTHFLVVETAFAGGYTINATLQ